MKDFEINDLGFLSKRKDKWGAVKVIVGSILGALAVYGLLTVGAIIDMPR